MTDASSYGINSPHVHLGTHSEDGPVVRLSPGSTTHSTVERLSAVLTGCSNGPDDTALVGRLRADRHRRIGRPSDVDSDVRS